MTFATFGDVLLILAAIPSIAAPIIFSRVTWWRSRWGIHLMAYMAAVALVLILGLFRLAFGTHVWFEMLRAFSYILLVVVLWWRMFFVLQAFREGSPDEGN